MIDYVFTNHHLLTIIGLSKNSSQQHLPAVKPPRWASDHSAQRGWGNSRGSAPELGEKPGDFCLGKTQEFDQLEVRTTKYIYIYIYIYNKNVWEVPTRIVVQFARLRPYILTSGAMHAISPVTLRSLTMTIGKSSHLSWIRLSLFNRNFTPF